MLVLLCPLYSVFTSVLLLCLFPYTTLCLLSAVDLFYYVSNGDINHESTIKREGNKVLKTWRHDLINLDLRTSVRRVASHSIFQFIASATISNSWLLAQKKKKKRAQPLGHHSEHQTIATSWWLSFCGLNCVLALFECGLASPWGAYSQQGSADTNEFHLVFCSF